MYDDADGDGFGDPATARVGCADEGVARGGDCDDADPRRHPDASETCDGVDEDCDAEVDEGTGTAWALDSDGDGVGGPVVVVACEAPPGFVADGGDCDDADPRSLPGGAEVCDGRDNDCDGVADVGAPGARSMHEDLDGDGFGGERMVVACEGYGGAAVGGDCDDTDPAVGPHAEERCNGRDDDCDDQVDEDAVDASPWYGDGDGDGYGSGPAVMACEAPPAHAPLPGDCAPDDARRHPGAREACNGLDDDCNGLVDEEIELPTLWWLDGDGDGYGAGDPVMGCAAPDADHVANGDDCDDTDGDVSPAAAELPDDGVDQDCDGAELCYVDVDLDGYGGPQLAPHPSCEAMGLGPPGDCDDRDRLVGPHRAERPHDGVDNDCDPSTPDDDIDGDGLGFEQDCNDFDPDIGSPGGFDVSFVEIGAEAGLAIDHGDALGDRQCNLTGELFTGGAAVADVDGDGLPDIFLPRLYRPDLLLLNRGDGTFDEVGRQAGVDSDASSAAALFFDIDGDADLDLYVTAVGPHRNRLYVNDGTGVFSEEAVARGVDLGVPPNGLCSLMFGASAADVDGDGDLDLHVTAWTSSVAVTDRARLFLNDGQGWFTDATVSWGLDLLEKASFTTSFGDLDGDGLVDAAIAGDWDDTTLWRNTGTAFEPITDTALELPLVQNGMGGDLADVDDDGDLDWMITAIYGPWVSARWDGNRLYVNDGAGAFSNHTQEAGLMDAGWGWGVAFVDFDNDSHLDVVVNNGFEYEGFRRDTSRLYHNDGTGFFTDQACLRGLRDDRQSIAVVPFDLEGDGDQDILSITNSHEPRLFRNDGGDARSWLRVELRDQWPNPYGIGARIDVQAEAGGRTLRRDIHANSNMSASRPPEVHVGLGDHEGPLHLVRITWPDGEVLRLRDVSPRQRLTVQR